MDRSEVIELVKETTARNDFGINETTRTTRTVFCQVNSITRAEFFDAGRAGLNPSLMFSVFVEDYEDEDTLIYDGKAYAIYRTYLAKNDELELYAERKGGTNGVESS